MRLISDVVGLVRSPKAILEERLRGSELPQVQFLLLVTPLVAIRPVMILFRSILSGTPLPGFVVGLGSFAQLCGAWLATALVLPAVLKQVGTEIDEHQSYTLTTYGSIPLWVAGVLYLLPEEPSFVFWWTRLLVLLISSYGWYLFVLGMRILGMPKKSEYWAVGATAVAVFTIYAVLSVLFGLGAHVVLFLIASLR